MVPQNMMAAVKNEVIGSLPKGKVSYPINLPTNYQYQIMKFCLVNVKVVAESIRASNIEMNLQEMDIDFLPD